jgi:hypothetical protein
MNVPNAAILTGSSTEHPTPERAALALALCARLRLAGYYFPTLLLVGAHVTSWHV